MAIGGLLFDRNGLYKVLDKRRYPSVRENVLCCQVVNRLLECQTNEELVKGGLVVIEYEIWALALIVTIFCDFDSVLNNTEKMHGVAKNGMHYLVAELQPFF